MNTKNQDSSNSNIYMEPINDSLLMRKSGEWAKNKLYYLKEYLTITSNALFNNDRLKWRAINYFDLFAGPGKCYIDKNGSEDIFLGSPLIALNLENKFSNYYFFEKDEKNHSALKKRSGSLKLLENILILNENCNTAINPIIDKIVSFDKKFMPDVNYSFNIAFIDPEGFDHPWSTIKKLAECQAMDLIIYFPLHNIKRIMGRNDKCNMTGKVDEFFGTSKWQEIYEKYETKDIVSFSSAIIEFYKNNLCRLGYKNFNCYVPEMKNSKEVPLYRLLYASKHPLGYKFWKSATRKNVWGQGRFDL